MTVEENESFWYPLDNAAKIFPAITNNERTSVFRISASLKNAINISALYRALHKIEGRFPYYKVKMRKGFFWYYLESDKITTPIVPDVHDPCRVFNRKSSLFRVLAKGNRLSVEFSHIITDGGGAFEYFQTLLISYLNECGTQLPQNHNYLKPGETPDKEEFEDAYNRYFIDNIPKNPRQRKAFHLPYPTSWPHRFSILTAIIPSLALKKVASEKNVSITTYLTSVYIYALQDIYEELKAKGKKGLSKKISIQVPINLRGMYPSKTMRNFSLFVMPEIDLRLGYYSFDEILKTVHHQIQLETDEKLINKILSRNVGSERKLIIRGIPLFIKSLALRMNYYSLGSNQYSGVLSNLGRPNFPPEIADQIEYLQVIAPPPNKLIKTNCGIIGFKDQLIVTFGNISYSKELEKRFFRFLSQQGINVRLTI